MKNKLLSYIDDYLNHSESEPTEQLVYIMAKLSLISTPVAWAVKRSGDATDALFNSREDAIRFLKKSGRSEEYIIPLFTTVKVSVGEKESRHLTPRLPSAGGS